MKIEVTNVETKEVIIYSSFFYYNNNKKTSLALTCVGQEV
jgi:hypothetical protein